ncbi:hypothetical protein ABIB25_002395 [Nakamurella sp. UYEF19]|uniref:hypothetical protein n=1 Tax=Nakamurella sp. UYEF19 TaxID=1756392 RepID=UPI0033976FFF
MPLQVDVGSVRTVPARMVGLLATGATLVSTVLLILRGSAHDWTTGDTKVLVTGMGAITKCWRDGVYCNGISKFALLQQIPAYVLHLLGMHSSPLIGALVWLNAIAVVGLIAVTVVWAHRRAGLPLAVIGGLLMACGMLLTYSAQSFGEALAAAAFGGLSLSALRKDRVSRWLLVFAVLATISKETAAPFAFLLGVAAIGLSGAGFAVVRRAAIHLTIGVAVGELLDVGFNLFRFGKIYNPIYLAEARAPSSMWVSNGAGMLISPNAGIAWFWPGAAIAMVLLVLAVARPGLPGFAGRRIRWSAIAGLVVLAVMIASLADWWAPFGWYAWGPRLLMPIAAGTTVLSLALIERHPLRRTWLSRPGAIALAIVCCLALLPTIGVVFRPNTYTAQITGTWKVLPYCAPGQTNRTQQQLNNCNNNQTWGTVSMPLKASIHQASGNWRYWAVVLLAWLSVVLWIRMAYRSVRRVGSAPSGADGVVDSAGGGPDPGQDGSPSVQGDSVRHL